MKKRHTLFLTILLTVLPCAAQVDMDKLRKEIRILDQVIQTAFDNGDREEDGTLQPGSIEAVYLARQGVVLEVEMNRGFMGIHMPDFHFDFAPAFDFGEFTMGEDMSERVMEAYSEAMEALSEVEFDGLDGAVSEEFRKELREIAQAKKAHLKEAETARREALTKMRRPDELSDAERESIARQAQDFKNKMVEASKDIEARMKKARAEQVKDWNARLKPFMSNFLNTLCEYGASLKSLPDNEYLTVVFREADRDGDEERDLIYVFKKSDLMACRDGRMTAAQLQDQAEHYSY